LTPSLACVTVKNMNSKKLLKLPPIIKAKILKTKEGTFIAELPKYDIFTEADNLLELDYNINDLIYTFFDVPKKYRGKIIYCRREKQKKVFKNINIPVAFQVYCTPELYNNCPSVV
jgi:hypothetical protein